MLLYTQNMVFFEGEVNCHESCTIGEDKNISFCWAEGSNMCQAGEKFRSSSLNLSDIGLLLE